MDRLNYRTMLFEEIHDDLLETVNDLYFNAGQRQLEPLLIDIERIDEKRDVTPSKVLVEKMEELYEHDRVWLMIIGKTDRRDFGNRSLTGRSTDGRLLGMKTVRKARWENGRMESKRVFGLIGTGTEKNWCATWTTEVRIDFATHLLGACGFNIEPSAHASLIPDIM